LNAFLSPRRWSSPPARGSAARAWSGLKPKLAAEVAYRGWTHDEKLRHASFKGLREKADEAKVYRLVCPIGRR